ncbi:Zn-ribbon domain-containing OB-fold protein [Prescottella equi]|uniref:Zn-ribbon domain-containing OB-fold protein n=1 Tax=Rhodococcus hoagii TaxID=43767 RepID=UPI003B009D52
MSNNLPGSAVEVPENMGGPHSAYSALLEHGILGFQACTDCSAAIFPPRGCCSLCGGNSLVWRASVGSGTVYSTTVISPRDTPPYSIVLVDLDEGYRMMSRVDRRDVAIDDRVVVDMFLASSEPLPLFTQVGASDA